MLDVNPDITIPEDITMNDLKEIFEKKNEKEENEEVVKQNQKISSLKNEKSSKVEEQTKLNSDSYYYGPANEFFMMKGKCYDKMVVNSSYSLISRLTSINTQFVLMENQNKILLLLEVHSLLLIKMEKQLMILIIMFMWMNRMKWRMEIFSSIGKMEGVVGMVLNVVCVWN